MHASPPLAALFATARHRAGLLHRPERPAALPAVGVGGRRTAQPRLARAVHRATTLTDGRVLITGGCTLPGCGGFDEGRASEFFDPVVQRFLPGPLMLSARASGTATLLLDGRVLLTGGYPGEGRDAQASAEVFDPLTQSFEAVDPMISARANHTATLLPDGRVLLAGGNGADGDALDNTEFLDPTTGTFTAGSSLRDARAGHSAAVVGTDVVLVGGTADLVLGIESTDVLHDGTWTSGPDLLIPRVKHATVALADGRVLVIGGSGDIEGRDRLASTEILDLAAGTATPGPDLSEPQYKLDGAVAELPDRRIVIAGGQRLDIYDPATDRITRVDEPATPRRAFVSATVLGPDLVLVAGGYDDRIAPTAQARLVRITP